MAVGISEKLHTARKMLAIRPGDTVRVWQKIPEKGKIRLQAFEGIVLARKHGVSAGATFTVRRIIGGVGVEKIFPLYSPMIDKIEILRRTKTRRAKLYYIRDKAAREIKRQMRGAYVMGTSDTSLMKEDEVPEAVVERGEGDEADTQTV